MFSQYFYSLTDLKWVLPALNIYRDDKHISILIIFIALLFSTIMKRTPSL